MRAHSYRNFEPDEFVEALEEDSQTEVRSALQRVESGRFAPFLEQTSAFFSRLDQDEQETFTRRNPGLVRWMSAYNILHDYNPYADFDDQARDLLDRGDWDVPAFERKEVGEGRTHLQDLYRRRRSYRNFTPHEIMEVSEQERIEVTEGQARELGLRSPEIREELDFPLEIEGREIARAVLSRLESGRFQPMLRAGHKFVAALDADEIVEFTRRNPGIIQWMSTYGHSEHLRHREQLTALTDIEWPVVPEVQPHANGGNPHPNPSNSRPADVADRITAQQQAQRQQQFDTEVTISSLREEIRQQMARGVLDDLAEMGEVDVVRLSEPGDPTTRLDTPAGKLTIKGFAEDVDRMGRTWTRTWERGGYRLDYSINRGRGEEAHHSLRVTAA